MFCSFDGRVIRDAQRGGLETLALARVPGAIQHFGFHWPAKLFKAAAPRTQLRCVIYLS